MADFTIEVPLNVKGGTGSVSGTSGTPETKKLNASMDNLAGEVAEGIGLVKILGDIIEDVYRLLQPIIKILSAILILALLPFMPILLGLINILLKSLEGWMDLSGRLADLVEWVADLHNAIWTWIIEVLRGGFEIISSVGQWLWDNIIIPGFQILAFIGEWIWNNILMPPWLMLSGLILTIWDKFILPAWSFLINVGQWIWETILQPAFSWLSDIGQWIWNIIKSPFDYLANLISDFFGIGSASGNSTSVNDAIIRPNGQVIKTSPSDTIFAVKDPSKLMGGNGAMVNNFNFNNPVIRSEQDMRKLTEMISKNLQSQLRRRHS